MPDPLSKFKRKVTPVVVDGETLHIRTWSVGERMEFARATEEKSATLAQLALRLSVCDESGKPCYTEADTERLSEVDGEPAQQIIDAALEANGLKAKRITDAKKD